MEVVLVLHPHTEPEGWRWAVHLCPPGQIGRDRGDGVHPWLPRVVNAGHGDTREDAEQIGQVVLYSVLKLFDLLAVRVTPEQVTTLEFDFDPFAGESLRVIVDPDQPMLAVSGVPS